MNNRSGPASCASSSAIRLLALAVLLPLLAGHGSVAGPAADWATWYEQALSWEVGATPLPFPAGGLHLERAGTTWLLEEGEVRVLPPSPDGAVTGLVFRGRGRFTMVVPDRWERENFAYRSGSEPREVLELPFTELTLRSVEDLTPRLPAPLKSTMLKSDPQAEGSHQRWLHHARRDVDARVAAGRLIPGDRYLIAEMETGEFGPLTWEYEPFRREQIRLEFYRATNDHAEVWVSLRIGDEERQPLIDITHAELLANLEHHSGRKAHDIAQGSSPLGTGYASKRQDPWTGFSATVTFIPRVDDLRAVPLLLEPLAEVQAVRDGNSRSLPFLRDHLGQRAVIIHNSIHDDSLVVLLEQPLPAGEEARLTIDYRIRTSNQVLGRDWYPRPADRPWDEHTARITVAHPKKIQIRACGRLESEDAETKPARTTWVVEEPCKAVGFSYGKGFKEVQVERGGLPLVHSFGTEDGITIGDIRRNVGQDLLDVIAFLEDYLGAEPPIERLLATRVTGYTQPYEGFINFSLYSYNKESPGLTMLLRGREAAAQFWVGNMEWSSYRDQWLAEALTDITTMMAIEAGGRYNGYYGQLIRTFNTQMIGSRKGTARSASAILTLPDYDRISSSVPNTGYLRDSEWLLLPNPLHNVRWQAHDLKNMGPIALGFRSSPAEVPYAFSTWNRRRGVLVLHMLRELLDNNPAIGKRDLFRAILGDFYRDHAGSRASTADFIDLVEKKTEAGWGWFFNQWVFGRGTPTLTWDWEVSAAPNRQGPYDLAIAVEKSEVPADFKVVVPAWIDFGDNRVSQVLLSLDRLVNRVQFPVPEKPERLIINPRHEVLAEVLEKE